MLRPLTRAGLLSTLRWSRFTNPLAILISFLVCCSLLLSSLVLAQPATQRPQAQVRQGHPEPGPPEGSLPNLDQARRHRQVDPEAPVPIPSAMRGRRKSLEPRNGRKVGNPGTTAGAIGEVNTANSPAGTPNAVGTLQDGGDKATSTVALRKSLAREQRTSARARLNHSRPLLPTGIYDDSYIQGFFQTSLNRSPYTSPNEQSYWNDVLRAAYNHGQASMVMAIREMGKTLFESAEYAARQQTNHWYVRDLYKTYLLREPDSGGWAFWEGLVPSLGRESVRRGFDESTEFINDVATVTPNGTASTAVTSLLAARVDPNNQSGSGLLGRPADWSVSLLSLPGRANLDLGLGLSYSSAAVWTRSGPYIYFDEDNSSLSPGFRIGFPTVQEKFFNAQISQNAYLLITSAGSRIELRETPTAGVYEAANSSYLQLTENSSSNPTLLTIRSTDGSQMSYTKIENEWRCTQVKDRNGNYLTVNYNSIGDITTVVDTLGRTITFNYDGNANLSTITQSWNGTSHTWATFYWDTKGIQPGFSGVALIGVANASTVSVVSQVVLDDGAQYNFSYPSTQLGVVTTITRTTGGVQRSSLVYDYTSDTGDPTPRLLDTKVTAENWTGINGVPSQVTTGFPVDTDGGHRLTLPDGTVHKEFYGTDWKSRLVVGTKDYASVANANSNSWQKQTTTTWEHDGLSSAKYPNNPRVTQTYIDDGANHKLTTIGYTNAFTLPDGVSCKLPSDVYEYAADASTVLRRTHTDYNLDSAYLNRWLIGLPAAKLVCDGSQGAVPCTGTSGAALFSKITMQYDETGSVEYQGSPVQHDDTNYGSGLVQGRANLSSTRRYDISNITQYLASTFTYNTAGSVITTTDPAGHQSSANYADSFSDSTNHNTFAYPTTATDEDGFSSYVQYNYDFGAKMRIQGPPPSGQSQGAIQTFTYDGAARVQQVTTVNNNAYVRYVYGPYYIQSYSSVNNVADEAYAIQTFDGAGRVIGAASNYPGSAGGYRAQLTKYDTMGRVLKQSNPSEINVSWVPSGDDAAGWLYTQETYDWKGRALVTTNTDTTQKTATYGGCGCAGGEVVTLQDEVGRKQRSTTDVLGRQLKVEVLKADGTTYSTVVTDYNVLDQVKAAKSYKGAALSDFSCPTGTCLQSLTTYDGYGRVSTQKQPQQTTPATYTYYADGLVHTVTDGRGVVATNTYNNNRHLLTSVAYSTESTPVSFSYDGAGNRLSMADATGSITYHYDTLSRLSSETRVFTPLGSTQYTVSYGYNLAGALSSITDPTGAQISYNYDQAGQLTGMPATGYTGVTSLLSNVQYRAFGGMKHATYGNSLQVDLTYNQRQQIGQYQVSGFHQWANGGYNGAPYSMGTTMSYYDDGRTNTAYDLNDGKFDRKYEFDFSARLSEAYSGVEAHGQAAPPLAQANSPYRQTYTYNEWNDVLTRTGRVWTLNDNDSATYTNDNKRQGWGYDAGGNTTNTSDGIYTYDAAGRPATFSSYQTWQMYPGWDNVNHPDGPAVETWDTFDGTGQVAKHVDHSRVDQSWDDGEYGFHYWVDDNTTTSYFVHSTVLGGKTIEELNSKGSKVTGYVYAGGARVATQHVYNANSWLDLEATNPVTGSAITSDANASYPVRQEPDSLGRDLTNPPDVGLINQPLNNSVFKDRVMPVEYTGGPSDYYEQGNAWWDSVMTEQTRQYQAGYFEQGEDGDYFEVKNKFINAVINQRFGEAAELLANNPNFELSINGTMTAGQGASDALVGALANLPGDPLGINPQKSSVTVTASIPKMEQVDCPGGGVTADSASGKKNTVILDYSDGTREVRSGGSRSWRNNNPGNIRPAGLQGEIGKAGGFAVFGRDSVGQSAIVELLSRHAYQALTIGGAIARWAPPSENDTAAYQSTVQNLTGMDSETQMSTLSQGQIQSVANAIRSVEGSTAGTVTCWRQKVQ
jgi:YD repeat-containing protein